MSLRVVFAGTPEFALPSLNALLVNSDQFRVVAVFTQPDRPAGRGRHVVPSPVKQLAVDHHIPVYQPKTFKDEAALNQLIALSPDVMVVVAYGLILPIKVLDTPKFGCINVHASLLPRWRGAAPIQRAIEAGDSETGVTIMQMAVGLDTGPMLFIKKCPILKDDTGGSLHDKLASIGADALVETLSSIGKLTPEKQDDHKACVAAKISKEEARIDWSLEAKVIANKIRAFNPWPVAFTELHHQNLRIYQAHVISNDSEGQPGEIIQSSEEGIDVFTGGGVLRILQLQLPGGKMLAVKDFYHARKTLVQAGVKLPC